MLINDAVDAIEAVGGIWLGMSAIAFILLAIFVKMQIGGNRGTWLRGDGHVLDLLPRPRRSVPQERAHA